VDEVFPSGHLTFYLCVATLMFLLSRWTLLVTVPAGICFGWMIVALRYHIWLDIYGAWLMAPPVTLLCCRAFDKWTRKRGPVSG
jgi:membrane-associated phospholipid phosphatase